MNIADDIMKRIGKGKFSAAPVAEASHLYRDLGYDSLAFVRLLSDIETVYAIEFELLEMSACLNVGRLIALVEGKRHD